MASRAVSVLLMLTMASLASCRSLRAVSVEYDSPFKLAYVGTEIRLNNSNHWYFIIPAVPDMAMPSFLSYFYKAWNIFSTVKTVFDFLPIGLLLGQFKTADDFPVMASRSLFNGFQEENKTEVEPLMFPLEQQGLSESEEEYTKEVESLMLRLEQHGMNGSQEEYTKEVESLMLRLEQHGMNGSQEEYNTAGESLEQGINGSQEEYNNEVESGNITQKSPK